MASEPMNRETALRIALATKALPGVSVSELLEILQDKIEGTINEKKLSSVSVNDIKTGFSGDDGDFIGNFGLSEMKEAVRILWGEKFASDLPTPQPIESVPPRSVRVAICSNNGEKLDGHFGSCLRFLVYQVSASWSQLIDVRSTIDADLAEDKNAFRTDLIADCQVVYMVSVGGPAAAKIIRNNIYPIKRQKGGSADQIVEQLQAVIKNSPPPWLAKFIGDTPEKRVRFERDDADTATVA